MAKLAKKQSKRISTRKRTKIERKVREHNRKVRKESKKNPNPFKKKKGFDVPNNCPFKDDVLKEAEDHKRRLEEERAKQKERRKKEREMMRNKKRMGLDKMVSDAEKRAAEFEKKNALASSSHDEFSEVNKNVELSLKQYYREFKKVVEAADVVLQVLDARDPLGSRCEQVEEAVLGAGPNKRIVLLLNKVDLVPRENVEAWLKYLRQYFPTIAFKASTQSQSEHLSHSKVPLNLASDDLRKSSRCLGAELLLKLLGNYCRNKDIRTSISVGVVGFPNTGKSSVINSLKRAKVCSIGATPGVTKNMQSVQLDKHIQLLDSPGIVMASSSDPSNVLKNCVKVEALEDPVPAVSAVLRRCTKQKLMMQYGLPDFSDVQEFLALLARKQGRLKKGGRPDVVRAGRSVLLDWNQGRITYYTQPPDSSSTATHLDAQIVTEMSKEFDIDSLLSQEEETLKGLKNVSSGDVVMSAEDQTTTEVMLNSDASENEDDSGEEDMEEEEEEEDKKFMVPEKVAKSKSKKPARRSSKDKVVPEAEVMISLKQRKKDFKKMKKQRRRADAVAGQLADAMEGAFSLGSSSADNEAKGDDYNFSTDFK